MGIVGLFDSGVGGLTVLESVRSRVDSLSFHYFGDTARCPYGDRPLDEVRTFALSAVEFLVNRGCDRILMACNISSSVALEDARERYPGPSIHGLINDRLVRSVRDVSGNQRVGVLATRGTVESGRYRAVLEQAGLHVVQQSCPPLVPLVEAGHLTGERVEKTLRPLIEPLVEAGVDTVILGCTHYPFLRGAIQAQLPPKTRIVDPGDVLARELSPLLNSDNGQRPRQSYTVSGSSESLRYILEGPLNRNGVSIQKVAPGNLLSS